MAIAPGTRITLGGADRYEAEAYRNERQLFRFLSGGQGRVSLKASAAPAEARRSALPAAPASSGPSSATAAHGVKIGKLVIRGLRPALPAKTGALVARAKGGKGGLSSTIASSSGQPLPQNVRSLLEPAFGQSFGDVRIHVDPSATMASAAVSAEAFTLGRDIYFNRGYYDPSSARGIALLGHELTHVVQNRGGTKGMIRRSDASVRGITRQALLRSYGQNVRARVGDAWGDLLRQRQHKPGDIDLAAAEHYLYARMDVDGLGEYFVMNGLTVGYDAAKGLASLFGADKLLSTDGTPPTPPTAQSLRWGLWGCDDGLSDAWDDKQYLIRRKAIGADPRLLRRKPVHEMVDELEKNEAQKFAEQINLAVSRYKKDHGKVSFDDPQSHGFSFAKEAYASGKFDQASGWVERERKLNEWFLAVQETKKQVAENEVLYRALELNEGNLPLAMGTIANYFHDERAAASWVEGLGDNHKEDYYRYGGAFIGLQGAGTKQAGSAFAWLDIRATWANAFFKHGNPYIDRTGSKLLQTAVGKRAVGLIRRKAVASDGAVIRRSALDDSAGMWEALDGAVHDYGKPVTFDDPQDKLSWSYYMNTGDAAFNRAPGGAEATGRIEKWLAGRVASTGGTTQKEMIERAIAENGGNVTLAMGSLAEILCRGSNRKWAARIQGLNNDGKDYYRYAGAYVGLQPNPLVQAAGSLGSHLNILGNPIVYGLAGIGGIYHGVFKGDTQEILHSYDSMVARWKPGPNLWKLYEFNLGAATANGWKQHQHGPLAEVLGQLDKLVDEGLEGIQKKDLTVAGQDSFEQQAIANERMIFGALSRGAPLTRLQANLTGQGSPAIRRSIIGGATGATEQLADSLAPADLARLDLEMRGRRFIDLAHYEEELAKNSTTPYLRYGEAAWNAWNKAADRIAQAAKNGERLTKNLIQEVHKLACEGVRGVQGVPGEFKNQQNWMGGRGMADLQVLSPEAHAAVSTNPDLQILNLGKEGDNFLTRVDYTKPEQVEGKLAELFQWIEKSLAQGADPIEVAARAQRRFISIHPFGDGNGRVSRLVMDYVLQRAKLPPALLRDTNIDTFVSEEQWIAEVRQGVKASYNLIKRYTAPTTMMKLGDRLLSLAQRLMRPIDNLVQKVTGFLRGGAKAASGWIDEFLLGEEFGLLSKVYPAFKGFFVTLAEGLRAGAGFGASMLSGVSRIGRFLFGAFKGIMRFAGKIAGPLAVVATIMDIHDWFVGPSTLVAKASGPLKEILQRGDQKAWDITHAYYAPLAILDVLAAASFIGAIIPPAAPALAAVGAVTGLASLAWSGVSVPFTSKKWGGIGLPIAAWMFRKKRGSSQYDEGDPELGSAYHDVLERYGKQPGVSLDFTTKSRLERFLGRELGEVRIHSGPLAREVARATEAQALAFGRDIYLPSEQLGSSDGPGLLAHEATHVAQAAPATPTASPRSLGAGASAEAMEDVARSVEARFTQAVRAAPAFPLLAEPVVRQAPIAPAAVVPAAAAAAAAPVAASLPAAPVAASAPAEALQRREAGGQAPGFDPVQAVMQSFQVAPSISQEEFLAICTERLVDLMKDEIASDAERREQLTWNYDLPMV